MFILNEKVKNMEHVMNQKEINLEIFKYLNEIEKRLDREYNPTVKLSIITEIENHLKEKLYGLMDKEPITRKIVLKVLADFGEPEEIVKEYSPEDAEKSSGALVRFFNKSGQVYSKVFPFSIIGEYRLYLMCALYMVFTFCFFSILPYSIMQVYITWIIGIAIIYVLNLSRSLNPNILSRTGSEWSTNLGKVVQGTPVKVWQPLCFYMSFSLIPIAINLIHQNSAVWLYIFLVPLLLVFSDFRGSFMEQSLVEAWDDSSITYYANRTRKRLYLFKTLFEVTFILTVVIQVFTALSFIGFYYALSQVSFPFTAISVVLLLYLVARKKFIQSKNVENIKKAKCWACIKLVCLIGLEIGCGIFIFNRGPAYAYGSYGSLFFSELFAFSLMPEPLYEVIAVVYFFYSLFAFRYFWLNVEEAKMTIANMEHDVKKQQGASTPMRRSESRIEH